MPIYGIISFILGLVGFAYFFIGPKQIGAEDVPMLWYLFGWVAWAAGLVSVMLGVESLRREQGKSIIWAIGGIIMGGLAMLILLVWLSCSDMTVPGG